MKAIIGGLLLALVGVAVYGTMRYARLIASLADPNSGAVVAPGGRAAPYAPGSPGASRALAPGAAHDASTYPGPSVRTYPDPAAPPGSSARVFVDPQSFDGLILAAVAQFADPVADEQSLSAYRESIARRAERAKQRLHAQLDELHLDDAGATAPEAAPEAETALKALWVYRQLAFTALYEGDHDEAAAWLKRALELSRGPGMPPEIRPNMLALLGINALRRGERDNCIGCVGPSSCIFPIARDAVHTRPSGSREAFAWFSEYLNDWPGDLRVRWLLNIAAMTLGEHPGKVPERLRVPVGPFETRTNHAPPPFENVAMRAGLIARGPDLAGGCVFDDFNGDGRPDLFLTSFDVAHGATLYVNRGDGTFEDRSHAAGLDDQIYALNAVRGDYDNDGDLDVLLLRGGWEKPARLSLLRNRGDATFEDVTLAAGLGLPIATEAAAWGDYDDDGKIDLFVCGEYRQKTTSSSEPGAREQTRVGAPDPRNHCRLYRNQGDGTFKDVAERAGVLNDRWAKGAAWGDFDNDGHLDLFVSNMEGPARLYQNLGDGTFIDVAADRGILGPPYGFTCMAWDYDNDGRLDIFVGDYSGNLGDVVADYLGLPIDSQQHPHLYHNLGPGGGFREVSRAAGLSRPLPTMSVNAADLDNDGDLDLHLGTGWMSLSGLVPELTYINENGRFTDVTSATRTGHLQKGHGVSFADYDGDGDLDLFVILGGGYPGDRGYNALFENPGAPGRHFLKIKLVGTRTNRAALGARIQAEFQGGDGRPRSVFRTIGNNGSFGGNSLVELIGLDAARRVDRLTVSWPVGKTTQVFENVNADQSIEITEGQKTFQALAETPRRNEGTGH